MKHSTIIRATHPFSDQPLTTATITLNARLTFLKDSDRGEMRLIYTAISGRDIEEVFDPPSLQVATLRHLAKRTQATPRVSREALVLLGTHLYELAFPPGTTARHEFEQDLAFARREASSRQVLRLDLLFGDTLEPFWSSMPWEFIYYPDLDQGGFLCGQVPGVTVTRTEVDPPLLPESGPPPLRMACVLLEPTELAPINFAPFRTIFEELGKSFGDAVELRIFHNPTYDALRLLVTPGRAETFLPDILHISGHAQPGRLAFIQPDVQNRSDEIWPGSPVRSGVFDADWIDFRSLEKIFSFFRPLLITFQPASTDAEAVQAGLDLVQQLRAFSLGAAGGFQYGLDSPAMASYLAVFYRYVLKGATLSAAQRAGRSTLASSTHAGQAGWSDRQFGAPVLFIQNDDFLLEVETPLPPNPTRAATEPRDLQPCPNPRCSGLVRESAKLCLSCGHFLDRCPRCNRVFSQTIEICGPCGYGLERLTGLEQTSPEDAPATFGALVRPKVEYRAPSGPPASGKAVHDN